MKTFEWYYKANTTMLDFAGTILFAENGFICRSVYEMNKAKPALAKQVQHVQVGDAINFYYSKEGKLCPIGKFVIITPKEHPRSNIFGNQVDGTALFTVNDEKFIKQFDHNGIYKKDITLNKFTGWLISKAGICEIPPDTFVRGRNSIVRY
jgi:hypothetical protein